MLIVFTRAIIIYVFLLIVMRLMGKKQLGELQPFEFAITLIVADLACIPMGDTSMPITYGLVPIFTLFVIHLLVTKLTKHSIKLRKLINGKPIIVINGDGIDYEMMKSLDMTVNDLMEALRSNGFFSPDEVEFAIVETNGDLSVLPKTENIPLTRGDIESLKSGETSDDNTDSTIPYMLIAEGKRMGENIEKCGIDENVITDILNKYSLKQKDVLILTVRNNETIFLQPKSQKAISTSVSEVTA